MPSIHDEALLKSLLQRKAGLRRIPFGKRSENARRIALNLVEDVTVLNLTRQMSTPFLKEQGQHTSGKLARLGVPGCSTAMAEESNVSRKRGAALVRLRDCMVRCRTI